MVVYVMPPLVTILLVNEPDLAALRRIDPERDWRELYRGERAWLLQTFLRLERAGLPVRLENRPRASEVVLFHAKHKRWLFKHRADFRGAVMVGVRGDLRGPLFADVEVLQNGRFADGRRLVFMPHWPQPGLVPRDARRGTRVRTLAFKGFERNLDPGFRSPTWRRFTSENGLHWRTDSVGVRADDADIATLSWPDYTTVDVVVALRPPGRRPHLRKPATKLCNAWAAGVPAILGPEYAYRELRRSELDYLEAASQEEAAAAVLKLRDNPSLYAAMVDNGRRRAAEYSVEAVTERWRRLLFEHIPRLAADPGFAHWHRLSFVQRRALARLRRLQPGRRAS